MDLTTLIDLFWWIARIATVAIIVEWLGRYRLGRLL